jgi:hypothetical protein
VHQAWILALAGTGDTAESGTAALIGVTGADSGHALASTVDALLVLGATMTATSAVRLISIEVLAAARVVWVCDLRAPSPPSAHHVNSPTVTPRLAVDDDADVSQRPASALIGAVVPALAAVPRIIGDIRAPCLRAASDAVP